MSFKAAIFDMDGTLLDSMHVWQQVDDAFFADHGMTTPPDYAAAISGMSFQQTAEYTKQRFSFPETTRHIMTTWKVYAERQYREQVQLKPGAAEYLRMLHRHGIKIAAATALAEELFLPALKRAGVEHLFSAYATTDKSGESKRVGSVYLRAAEALGVAPADCIVFEDILDGHIGARTAGMRSCNVYDSFADHDRAEINRVADFCTRDFSDAPKPENYRPADRAVIVPATLIPDPAAIIRPGDYVIAADRGFVPLRNAGIEPDIIIGDFDSLLPGETVPPAARVFPAEKDDTDTALALKHALEMGFTDIVLAGGLGDRADHSIANLQLMRYALAHGARMTVITDIDRITLLPPGAYELPPADAPARLSLLAFTPVVENLTIRGAKYCAEAVTLTDSFPLGVSNETLPGVPTGISFSAGALLMIRPAR